MRVRGQRRLDGVHVDEIVDSQLEHGIPQRVQLALRHRGGARLAGDAGAAALQFQAAQKLVVRRDEAGRGLGVMAGVVRHGFL